MSEPSLENIAWHKVRVSLRNERNQYQKQHPLFIFQAICNFAAGTAGINNDSFFFHPLTLLPSRMHKGAIYELEVVFPRGNPDSIARLLDGLDKHLMDQKSNFSLQHRGIPVVRSVGMVADEIGSWPEEEICLNFLTPFPFDPKDKKRNWLIDPGHFVRLLVNRINRFYDLGLKPEQFPCDGIRLLPYYWQFEQHSHQSRSNGGRQQALGMAGPLYMRGTLHSLLPLLLACSELHCGRRAANGQGYYQLVKELPFFDNIIADFDRFRTAIDEIERNSDIAEEIATSILDKPEFLGNLHDRLLLGQTSGKAASGFYVDKRRGGKRLIATLAPEDYLAHKFLHRVLSGTMDRMFEEASVGFRPGRSREEAAKIIRGMFNEGCGYVFESDIAAFFDEIDWDILAAKIDKHLPLADRITRRLLNEVIRTSLMVQDKPVERDRGLLQGSHLSPLLANLYLDSFDEEMERDGFRLVRYADDFVVLARSQEEAEKARTAVRESLAKLKLTMKEEKSRVAPVDMGFSFLGIAFGPGMDEDYVGSAAIAKTLFVTSRFVFVGLDYDSVIIRKDKQLLARFPIRQVAEIVILGSNTLSTMLLHRCAKENIPVSFCSPTGYYYDTLRPDSKKHFEISALHSERHVALAEADRAAIAARVVIAKISNYLAWFRESWPAEPSRDALRQRLETFIASVAKAESIATILGYEGAAAKEIFRFINDRLTGSFFKSKGREKRTRKDPWNSLLDFAYSLLFTRINVLLRGRGLNPYLGILHSHKDNYESLVCDLQEPFRCRMDRFVARLINLNIIQEASFEQDEFGRYRLTSPAIGTFLERFEQEMATRLGHDGGALKQLIIAQVHSVQQWANGTDSLRIYQADKT